VSGNNDLEFIDVIVLKKIDAESTVESFGSRLGGIFEAANILGGIKLKGYIDIHSIIGNSPVLITEKGSSLLHDLDLHSKTPLSKVDDAVLDTIKKGFKEPGQISRMLNINPRDIAYSLNKLWVKGMIDVYSNNGKVDITLTTKGFEKETQVEVENNVRNKLAQEIAVNENEDDACETGIEDKSMGGMLQKYSFIILGIGLLLFALIVVLVMLLAGI